MCSNQLVGLDLKCAATWAKLYHIPAEYQHGPSVSHAHFMYSAARAGVRGARGIRHSAVRVRGTGVAGGGGVADQLP